MSLPTLLHRLASMPIDYFIEPLLQARLFGTLVAVCHGDEAHSSLLARDMHLSWLMRFIAKQLEHDSTPVARMFASCFSREHGQRLTHFLRLINIKHYTTKMHTLECFRTATGANISSMDSYSAKPKRRSALFFQIVCRQQTYKKTLTMHWYGI